MEDESNYTLSIEGVITISIFLFTLVIISFYALGASPTALAIVIGIATTLLGSWGAAWIGARILIRTVNKTLKGERDRGIELQSLANKRETYKTILAPIYGLEISSLILDAPLDRVEEYCSTHYIYKQPYLPNSEIDKFLVDTIHIGMGAQLKNEISGIDLANNYRGDLLKNGDLIPIQLLIKLVLLSPNISQNTHSFLEKCITDLSGVIVNTSNAYEGSHVLNRIFLSIVNKYAPNASPDLLSFIKETTIDYVIPLTIAAINEMHYSHTFPKTPYFKSYWEKYSQELIQALRDLDKHLIFYNQEKYRNLFAELTNLMFNIEHKSFIENLLNIRLREERHLPNAR